MGKGLESPKGITKREARRMLAGKEIGDEITIHYTSSGALTCAYLKLGFRSIIVETSSIRSIAFSGISNIT